MAKTFNHIGVPTTRVHEGETYLEGAKLYVTDYNASENKIEWLRFADGSPMPGELQSRAHVAFEVDDLAAALQGQKILIEPFEPMPGLRVAFIMEEDQPVELMQFSA